MSLNQQCLPLPRRRKRHSNGDEADDVPQQISDLSEIDASTYLASVSAQASKMPFVFVAPQKEKKGDLKQQGQKGQKKTEAEWQGSASMVQYLFSDRLQLLPPPSAKHLPFLGKSPSSIEEYSQSVLNNFSKLRLYLHQCIVSSNTADSSREQSNRTGSNISNSAVLGDQKVTVPRSKDSKNWHIFCLGKDEACGNIDGYYDYDEEDDDDDEMDDNSDSNDDKKLSEPAFHKSHDMNPKQVKSSTIFKRQNVPLNGYEPTTSLLCQFDQIIVRRVLHHHIQFVSQISLSSVHKNRPGEYTMTKKRGSWIYALLSRLEKPLHRDEASSLSTLLRELCRLRSEIPIDDEDVKMNGNQNDNEIVLGDHCQKDILATLNTLIIIVGIYFEQCSSLESIMKVK